MKIMYAKLPTTTGRTQAAQAAKMNTFGQWLSTSFMAAALAQTQAQLALAKKLLLNHLQNQALQNPPQAENLLRNNPHLFLQKNTCYQSRYFLFLKHIFLPLFLPADSEYFRCDFFAASGFLAFKKRVIHNNLKPKTFYLSSSIFCAVR